VTDVKNLQICRLPFWCLQTIAELGEFFWKSGKKMQKTFAAVMCVHRFCKYFAECRCRLAGVNAPNIYNMDKSSFSIGEIEASRCIIDGHSGCHP